MAEFSPSHVQDFLQHRVWREIQERIQFMKQRCETDIESPDPFTHGVAVGRRRAIQDILNLPSRLKREASNEPEYKTLRPG